MVFICVVVATTLFCSFGWPSPSHVPVCRNAPGRAWFRRMNSERHSRRVFPYRLLTPGDFRATSLPEQLAEHADRINAHATIRIRLTADSSFRITSGDFRSRIKIGPQFLPHLVNKTSLEAPVAIYRLSPFSAKTSSLRVSSGGSFCRNICIPL